MLFKSQPETKDPEIIDFLQSKRLRPKPMKALPLRKDRIFIDFMNHKNKINMFLSLNSRNKSFNSSMSPHYKKQSFLGPIEKAKQNKERKREKQREKMPEFKFEELIDIINREENDDINNSPEEDLEKSYWDIMVIKIYIFLYESFDFYVFDIYEIYTVIVCKKKKIEFKNN